LATETLQAPRHLARPPLGLLQVAGGRSEIERVSIYTVARELGHQSDEMVKRIYAHLGATRHRSGEVEYWLEQHLDQLSDRVRRLGFVTGKDTSRWAGRGTETPAPTEVEAGEDLPEWARRDSNARPLAPEASALSN
jgi:hypothetical protein